jgi:excisionase family DNA binding protein
MTEIQGRRYLTPEEAAFVLDCTADHARRLQREGRIEGWMDRRRRWLLEQGVREYARARGIPVGQVVRRAGVGGKERG